MTTADLTSPMTLQHVHPGGFFWNVSRSEREAIVRRLATETRQMAVIARSDVEADDFAERLTLGGLPVITGKDPARSESADSFLADGLSTLVATADYVISQGPIRVPLAIHLRVSSSVREYSRRLEAVPSAAHVSLVIPEDESYAESLRSYLRTDKGHGEVLDVTLKDVIDLTDSEKPAEVSVGRRRFPLRS